MRPTKFADSGVGVGDSVGGNGVPIAIGALGGRSTEGSRGVARKPLRIDTIETITKNETHSRILSFHAPMERVYYNWRSKCTDTTDLQSGSALIRSSDPFHLGPLEEPARSHAQTVMPCWQSRCVQRESRLSRERSTKCFSAREYCCSFRPETDCLAQLFEMLRVHFVTFHVSLDVASRQRCLLES